MTLRSGASAFLSCLVMALAMGACGGDDEPTATSSPEKPAITETVETEPAPEAGTAEPETQTQAEPTPEAKPQPPPATNGESSDLPLCSQGPAPCRLEDGSVLEPGSGGARSGENSDLPLCSAGPPPCRRPDGSVAAP